MFGKTNSQPAKASNTAESSKKSVQKPTASGPSILGRDLVITGDITTDGEVQIDGRLEGNIKAGTVTIGEQGAVNGKITAQSLHVRGKINGKVDANTVSIAETANVQADILQDTVTIANGAFFDGKCSRKTKSTAPKASTPKATSKPATA